MPAATSCAPDRDALRERGAAAAIALLLHLALIALIVGWRAVPPPAPAQSRALSSFDVMPPVVHPQSTAARRASGVAAPPARKATPSPIVAPDPPVPPPPTPVQAAPVAAEGVQSTAGASLAGAGSGAGGVGAGRGSGGSGSGTGGGLAAPARLLRGAISARDYPRAARRARAEGIVVTAFTVGTDGRVRGCAVSRSSGHPELDAVTCRLIEQRFRYRPASDADGRPVAEPRGWQQRWWLEPR